MLKIEKKFVIKSIGLLAVLSLIFGTLIGLSPVVSADASDAEITAFSIPGQMDDSYIYTDLSNLYNTISVDVPFGTDVTELTPAIEYVGKSITPESMEPQDFTNMVTYTVVSEDDALVRVYNVYVYVRNKIPEVSVAPSGTEVSVNSDKLILSFDLPMMEEHSEFNDYSVEISGGTASISNPVWSDYEEEWPKTLTYDLTGLDYDTEYTVTIKGFWSFQEMSMGEVPIIHTFTTESSLLKDPPSPVVTTSPIVTAAPTETAFMTETATLEGTVTPVETETPVGTDNETNERDKDKDKEKDDAPGTGDSVDILLWLCIGMSSLLLMLVTVVTGDKARFVK